MPVASSIFSKHRVCWSYHWIRHGNDRAVEHGVNIRSLSYNYLIIILSLHWVDDKSKRV